MRAALAATLLLAAAPAAAQDCRLALALAIDVSSSVDAQEDALQRNGLAAALLAPEVQSAFFAAPQPVALAVYEWSGRFNQALVVDWQEIDSPLALAAVAATIRSSQRSQTQYPTALGYALGYGATLLTRAPPCARQTLDVAGDGENNDGFGPRHAYAAFPFDGVTVNGLVVDIAEDEAQVALFDFYRDEVLRGPGAFLEIARGFSDYETAMRRKLEREVMPRMTSEDARPRPGNG